jgi:flagellar biosynthesis/type III secretory pathway protein FliH
VDARYAVGPVAQGLEVPKAGDGARRIAAEVFEARLRARSILSEAEAEARRIREGAEGERAAARLAAAEAGRQEGLGRAAAEVARGAAERDLLLSRCTGEVLDVAAAIARCILGREVRPGVDAVGAAGLALSELRGVRRATLRARPEEVEEIRGAGGRLGAAVGRLRIVGDPALSPGEVVVEGDGALVDGRFPARIAELRRALEELEP